MVVAPPSSKAIFINFAGQTDMSHESDSLLGRPATADITDVLDVHSGFHDCFPLLFLLFCK